MKNRNIQHINDWATPPSFYNKLNDVYNFDFDPCPYLNDLNKWDGLKNNWKNRNFINPPYSRELKEAFVIKAIEESKKGKLCVMLLPVSTSTNLFHNHILPNATKISFVQKRIQFIGVNTKNQWVNWHLWNNKTPENVTHVKNSGMHDSMIVVFDGNKPKQQNLTWQLQQQ